MIRNKLKLIIMISWVKNDPKLFPIHNDSLFNKLDLKLKTNKQKQKRISQDTQNSCDQLGRYDLNT